MVNVFGFTLLRNGVKYDYTFEECLTCLSELCQKTYLALGDCDDATPEVVRQIPNIQIKDTIWNMNNREGGIVLSEQTNEALNFARLNEKHTPNAWGIYLQCDEIFHEDDYKLILDDLKKAHEQGCDVVSFRYLHFWQSHHKLAINKKWYPQEIRAVKLDSKIESWGDAQSFRNYNKVYQSEARVFHYGHVREEDAYKSKKTDILKMYHSDEKLPKYKKREKKFDNQTICLDYWGPHPKLMHDRIEKLGEKVFTNEVENLVIKDSTSILSKEFVQKIKAKNVRLIKKTSQRPSEEHIFLDLNPGILGRIFNSSKVPEKMYSKIALPWNQEFKTTLLLSEKNISVC